LEASITGQCKKWDPSSLELQMLKVLTENNPALQTNESAAIRLQIECQLEEGPISNSTIVKQILRDYSTSNEVFLVYADQLL